MNPKEKINTLVATGKIREALQFFLEKTNPNEQTLRTAIFQLSAQWNQLEDEKNKGIVSVADANLQANKINIAILNYVNNWDINTYESELEQIINSLPVSDSADLGALQMVNCDRITPLKKFNRSFEEKKTAKSPFQFYFLCGCPDEQPNSLSERIIYEIMEKESLDLSSSVSYPFQESDDFKRVLIENLPFSNTDVATSKKKLKEYVQKRFRFADSDSFETFIETGLPKILYKYIATVFKLEDTDWEADEGEIIEYLQWMIDTFKTAHPDVPTFVFLFVIKLKNLHDTEKVKPRNTQIVKDLKAFCESNDCALFDEIVPLKEEHIEGWLGKLGVDNPNDATTLINAFSKSLSEKDLMMVEGGKRFHMKDVEPLQEKIVRKFRSLK
jgi:hypothetical protein